MKFLRKREWIVVWPIYFDKSRSRSEGRRVPLHLSINRPTLQEIVIAVKKLGLDYIVEEDKKHPSTWFEYSGRVLIKKAESKSSIIKKIAEELAKSRLRKSRS